MTTNRFPSGALADYYTAVHRDDPVAARSAMDLIELAIGHYDADGRLVTLPHADLMALGAECAHRYYQARDRAEAEREWKREAKRIEVMLDEHVAAGRLTLTRPTSEIAAEVVAQRLTADQFHLPA